MGFLLDCLIFNVIFDENIWNFFKNLILRIIADSRITALRIVCMMTSTILWMMMSFLTEQWKFDFTYAAAVRNVWSGSILALPLVLIHACDSMTGDFYMSSLGSLVYSIGLGLLSASTPGSSCRNSDNIPKCAGKAKSYLYGGLALTIVGLACLETSLSNFEIRDGKKTGIGDRVLAFLFGDDDDRNDRRRRARRPKRPITCKFSISSLITVAFLSMLILIYVNVIKSWHARVLIATIFVSLQTLNFILGKKFYNAYVGVPPRFVSSFVVTILRVLVASTSKLSQPHPGSDHLYKGEDGAGVNPGIVYLRNSVDFLTDSDGDDIVRHIDVVKKEAAKWKSTEGMKCLDKAAIILESDAPGKRKMNRWKLCTVAEVEMTKMLLHMIPLWTTCIVLGVVSSIGDTYFLEQANHLERQLGKLKIPLIFLLGCQKLAGVCIGKIFEKATEKLKDRKIIQASLTVAMAMVFSIACCVVAAKVEKRRLNVVLTHGLVKNEDERIPMSVFWLVPQFIFLGGLDTMFEQGNSAFSSRFPKRLARYVNLSTTGINGIGRIGGVLSVLLVGRITHRQHKASWFRSTLNESRLDQYYWLLAAMSGVALVGFAIAACWHFYGESNRTYVKGEEAEHDPLIEGCHWWCCGS